MTPTHTLMDLFAGCGAMTRGFVDSGRFEPTLPSRWTATPPRRTAANFGDHIITERIEDVPAWPHVDVVIGGPPVPGL